MSKKIVIINYNTQDFVDKLVMSINHFVKDVEIYVFDNSDVKGYINNFDNVHVIDNSQSAIIDFNKFLEKYPNRTLSGGKYNRWASAKHCYTVEKCIEIFDDNFLLLDSDVLIKKDITELFDDSFIYVAEPLKQPNGIIRVSPYMCFINVKMCKQNNIHYFDEKYMHGLCVTSSSDGYDTGAGFYINAKDFPHKDVKCDDYIVHYAHGSWKKGGYRHELTRDEFFDKYKTYWCSK